MLKAYFVTVILLSLLLTHAWNVWWVKRLQRTVPDDDFHLRYAKDLAKLSRIACPAIATLTVAIALIA